MRDPFKNPACTCPSFVNVVRGQLEGVDLASCEVHDHDQRRTAMSTAEARAEIARLLVEADAHGASAPRSTLALNDDQALASRIGAPLTRPEHDGVPPAA